MVAVGKSGLSHGTDDDGLLEKSAECKGSERAAPTLWRYSVLIDPASASVDRKEVFEQLAAVRVQTRPVWAPSHLMPFDS